MISLTKHSTAAVCQPNIIHISVIVRLIQYKLGAAYEDERRASGGGTAIIVSNCVKIIIPGSGITKQLILKLDLSLKPSFSLTVK